LQKLLSLLLANQAGQSFLARSVKKRLRLMGIGSGTAAARSGEKVLADLLNGLPQTDRKLCIFDVGANKGQFLSLMLDNLTRTEFSIHSFEPAKSTFSLLNQKHGNSPGVILNHMALAAEPGELKLYYDAPGSGLASLTKRQLDHLDIEFEQSETVTVSTVEAYREKNNIKTIDLLKIDVEGHELDVLSGARPAFEAGDIRMTSFEFGGCNIDTRTFLRDFFIFFKRYEMVLYRITPSGFLYKLTEYRETLEQFRTSNFIAVQPQIAKTIP
jgi:FkbM family methyltransferase